MINKISHLYLDIVLKNPKRVLILLALVLMSMLFFAPNFKLDASADSLILENDKDLITYRNPGNGIPHKLSHTILGKKAKLDIPEDTLLKQEMFE